MASGDVAERSDHDADRQAMRERDAEQSEAALPACPEKLIGANRAGAKEDQRKRAHKFSDKLLRPVVHGSASGANGEL